MGTEQFEKPVISGTWQQQHQSSNRTRSNNMNIYHWLWQFQEVAPSGWKYLPPFQDAARATVEVAASRVFKDASKHCQLKAGLLPPETVAGLLFPYFSMFFHMFSIRVSICFSICFSILDWR